MNRLHRYRMDTDTQQDDQAQQHQQDEAKHLDDLHTKIMAIHQTLQQVEAKLTMIPALKLKLVS